MFAPTCSLQASMFQKHNNRHDDEDDTDDSTVDSEDDYGALGSPLHDVFSYDSLIRVVSAVRNTTALFGY